MNESIINRIAYQIELGKNYKSINDIFLNLLTELFLKEKINSSESFENINKKMSENYGVNIPVIILKKWTNRYYELESYKGDDIYLPRDKKGEEVEKEIKERIEKENIFIKNIAEIRENFIQYIRNEFNEKITKEHAKKIFLNHHNLNYDDIEMADKEKSNKYQNYFQIYIQELCNKDETKFKIIENLTIANQFTQIVLSEDTENKKFLSGCSFYIDTPILLRLFGYDGMEIRDSYKKAIDLLRNQNVKLLVFEHTTDEMWNILFTWKKNIALERYDAKGVNLYLKARKQFTEKNLKPDNFIPLDKKKLNDLFKENQIEIERKMDITNQENWKNVIDETKLEKQLKKFINWKSFPDRIKKDLDSISSIMFMRNKKSTGAPKTYKNGQYFFLTDNSALMKAEKEFLSNDILNDIKLSVQLLDSICIKIWLSNPEYEKQSRSIFRAKCFSSIRVDENFKKRLYERISFLKRKDGKDYSEMILQYPQFEEKIYLDSLINKKDSDEDLDIGLSIQEKEFQAYLDKRIKESRDIAINELNQEHEKEKENIFSEGIKEGKKVAINMVKGSLWYRILNLFPNKWAEEYLKRRLSTR